MNLPEVFLTRMQALLGAEYQAFWEEYREPAFRGVRLNPLKCGEDVLRASLPFPLLPSGFAPGAFYGDYQEGVGRLPAHHAGMFYSQEPSASSAVTALDPRPGERVLDLCAAPGGKSTQIAGLLVGKGLLWSNETVRSRTGALLSNLERLGVQNAVVSCCHPQRLCQGLRGYFHRVLVDAPCSGEGMFRRNPQAAAEWSQQGVEACAVRQLAILDSAALAVAGDGVLVYSTCTFSPEENEGVVKKFLLAHPEFVPEPIEAGFGRPDLRGGLARRIYPMDGGEGHFVARFRRVDENLCRIGSFSGYLGEKQALAGRELWEELFQVPYPGRLAQVKDTLLLVPEELPVLSGLGVLRAGVELACLRKGRLEPAHGVFMSRAGADCRGALNFSPESPELAAFLRGEEIDCSRKGYTAVCVNGVTVGFGKASGGRLKNRYPKGLRNRS